MQTARTLGASVEDLSQRSEFGSVFANPDGTWTATMAPEPVQVYDADTGAWSDVDPTLVETGGEIRPAATDSDLVLSSGGDLVFAKMTVDGQAIEWRWPTTLPTPGLDGATATYPDVAPGEDLVVEATSTGFQHFVVLKEEPAEGFEVRLPIATHGAALSETAQGGLVIKADGNVVVDAAAPVMWDASENVAGDPAVDVVDTAVENPDAARPVLTLTPDEDFLSDPETVYPVTIDPSFSKYTNGDAWVQSAGYTTGQTSSPELRAGTYDSGSHKARSFIHFDNVNSTISGKQILSAKLALRNFHSDSCASGAINASKINESWSGSSLTWGNQPNVGMSTTYSPAHGGGSSCPAADATWDVRNILQNWADDTERNNGIRVAAVDETDNHTWREYRSANYGTQDMRPQLVINYNRYPKTPGTPLVSPSEAGLTTSLTPTLSATVKDPDGGTVKGKFAVTLASDGSAVWSGTSAAVASRSAASVSVPSGTLSNGIEYDVRVTAYDGSLNSIASSVATSFSVQLPASSTDPVIQQILDLSNPGTTEATVVEIVNGIVAGSSEDGVTTPLTFDQAKQELLNFMLDTSQAGPETPTSTPAASTCEWSIQAAGSDVVAGHDGQAVSLSPAVGTPDPNSPDFTGDVGGEQVHVTVYKGTPSSEVASLLATSEANMDALGAASISGAVDGEQESEVSQHFENLPAPGVSAAVAYRVDVGDAVEYGVPESGLTTGQLAMAAADTSRDCVRTGPDVGAELSTETGKIIFSNSAEVLAQASDTYPDTSSAVRYRTFIPGATANTYWVCGKFKGDDRTYGSYYDLGNRTRASVFFNWPDQTVDTTKHVGTTHRLAGYGRSAKAKTASSAGIDIHDASIAPTFGRIVITHNVGNPLCSFAGNITYNVVIEAWKNDGVARVSGTRVKVPAHEAYYYPETEAYGRTIMKKPAKWFICLNINCGHESLWETSS